MYHHAAKALLSGYLVPSTASKSIQKYGG